MVASSSKSLQIDTLISIYEKLKCNGNDYDYNLLSCLKEIALESYTENVDINELMLRKNYAFRALTLVSHELQRSFCQNYFQNLMSILYSKDPSLEKTRSIKILSEYVKTSKLKQKLELLQTITICLTEGEVNFAIFEQFPPRKWRIELLLYVLFKDHNADKETVQRVITNMNDPRTYHDESDILTNTEEVLQILVCNKNEYEFDIHFINDVFYVIPRYQTAKLLFYHNFSALQNEINEIKRNKLRKYFNDENCSDLVYFIKYPIDVILAIANDKRKSISKKSLHELKEILEISNMELTQLINLLLRMDPSESIDQWIFHIAFELVKDVIKDVFLAYDKYCRQVIKNEEALKIIHLVSTSSVRCTCSSGKCKLHHTMEYCDLLYALNTIIARVIFNFCSISEKVLETVETIIIGINNSKRISELINALNTFEDYNIKFTDEELYEFFSEFTGDDYDGEIHKHIIKNSFPGTYEKSVNELLEEIERDNPGVSSSVKSQFVRVNNCSANNSALESKGPIKEWGRDEIESWAKTVRKGGDITICDEEILAVIKRAAFLTVELEIRDIQLITVLIMINSNSGKGRLAQVNTGEGKTLVIAALAAYYVLRGHKVDIYTSSPLLAVPQSREFNDFFTTCGISVTHNIEPSCNYKSDVIYGTNNSFQADVLRDEFRKSGVRQGRQFDVAIVDEVDNMLIDGNNWILMLSCDMPAMDYLEVILAAIFIQVKEAANCLVERDGQTYYLLEENAIDDEGNIKQEVVIHEVPLKESKEDFIINCTESHMRKLIRDTANCGEVDVKYPEIKVPKHLMEIISKVHLRKWIRNAVSAIFYYVNGEDYIVRNGKITIVDADNTGVLKADSHWQAGLHQFLEIKHGARIQPESFTTNYISNVGLFSRYTSKLLGLTGTLGVDETKSFLHNTYEVDSVVIPPFKLKQHQHLKAIVVNKSDDQYIEIAKSCIHKLKNGRAALIIMKYIREAEEVANLLKQKFNYDSSKIKLFKTDDDSKVVEKPLQSGDIIITTNIAGRGTDIKLSERVEINGGLHVCLGFLPKNSRIEQQNIGRTSRKGNRGTSQFVLCDSEKTDIHLLKKIRDNHEKINMRGQSDTVKMIKVKDKIFKKFCDLLGEIKEKNLNRNEFVKKTEMMAVEERFAIWLVLNQDKLNSNNNEIFRIFTVFRMNILKDYEQYCLIKNPYMYVELGNKYLEKDKIDDAVHEYTRAIDLDSDFAEYAYYNRAWAYLKSYGNKMNEYGHFINKAIKDLEISRKLIEDKEYSLHLLQTASKGNVLSEQIGHKLNLYSIHKNTIELAIGPDVRALGEQIKNLKEDRNNHNLTEESKDKIDESIKYLEERSKDIGIIRRAKRNKQNIKIEPLGDDYISNDEKESHKEEIKEFRRNGWIGGFKITEIKPINWGTVLSLMGIGLGQLLIGAAITVFSLGAGASIGMGLIYEGVSDIITAVKDGIINRDFDWATWALMKVISVTVSIVCAGFKAMKDAAKTAYAGAKNIVVSGTKAFTQTTKQGWKIVAKKIGLDLAKGVAKEIVTDLVTYGIDKTVIPMIEETIIELVRNPIQQALLDNPKIATMLKLDQENKNHKYERYISQTAAQILSPEQNSKLRTIAMQIGIRVADSKGLALTRQILTGIIGLYELTTFTDDFINKMNANINKIDVQNNGNNGSEDTSSQNFNENQNEHIQQEENTSSRQGEDVDLGRARKAEEQVEVEKRGLTTDNLSIGIASMVSKSMLSILKGKIIHPVTQMGANYAVDKFSTKINKSLDTDIENYRSLKNVLHYQNKPHTESSERPKKITTEEQKKVDEIIDKVKNGGPAGLVHLGAISDATGRPIEVYDENGRLKFTVGDTKKSSPIEIQYHEPTDGSETGHFTLSGGREPRNLGTADNMCLFNVVSEQTGHSPNDLKKKTLNIMENNKSNLAKQVQHIKRLEIYDKSSLHEGGAQYNGRHPDHARHFLRNANGVAGFGFRNPGHSDIHIPFKGKTIDHLNAIADETKRQIYVYDKKGNLSYIVGEKKSDADPIMLEYQKPKGDTSAEYFSSKGGKEKYYLHDPNDTTFYNIISKQTGKNADHLKNATRTRMENMAVPKNKNCIENETLRRPKTGFISEDEQAFVLHHALQTEVAKKHMEELNKYKEGENVTDEFKRREVYISSEELKLPRHAYGGQWKNGKLNISWPVTDIMIVLQHYDGSQQIPEQNTGETRTQYHRENPKARVHILTFFPYPPKPSP